MAIPIKLLLLSYASCSVHEYLIIWQASLEVRDQCEFFYCSSDGSKQENLQAVRYISDFIHVTRN